MIKEIKMPNLGTTVDEMKIVKWLKNEGDSVERGEPIFEVETDKAIMEVESYLAGYLKKIVAGPGEAVTTGSIVAYIGDKTDKFEGIFPSEPVKAEDKVRKPVEATREISEARVSLMIKKLAEKRGIDITKIKGSSPNGLILKEDIISADISTHTEADEGKLVEDARQDLPEVVPFSRVGTAIAKAMTRSKTTIPHVYLVIDVDASAMKELYVLSGKKYSYNAMIVYSVAKCLKAFPYLAARYDEKGRIMAKEISIGFAVAKGDDLLVPVVKGITDRGNELARIEQDMQQLIKKVETGELKQKDISGGVFTVSNLGSYGVRSFTAVINPPEAAILAVGAIQDRVMAKGGGVFVSPMMTLTLSVDHRIVNGVYAAAFLKELKENIEKV